MGKKFRTDFNSEEDVQIIINQIPIEKRTDLWKYVSHGRFGRLKLTTSKLIFKDDQFKSDWTNINELSDFQNFIDSHPELESFMDFRKKYSGLTSKYRSLGFKAYELKFKILSKPTKNWDFIKSEKDVINYLSENNIDYLNKLKRTAPGLINKILNLGYRPSDFFKSKVKDYSDIVDIETAQKRVDKEGIMRPSDLPPGLSAKLYKLGIKRSDIIFPNRLKIWTEYTLEMTQAIIDEENDIAPMEFEAKYPGLKNHSVIKGYYKKLKFSHSKKSSLEKQTEQFLIDNSINYYYHYRFPDLKRLEFDFYLPDYSLVLEPGGDHHISSVWEDVDRMNKNDKIKYDYCTKNNIDIMYYFKFWNKENYLILDNNGYFCNYYTDFELFTKEVLNLIKKKKGL